jgi:hypothetical protein
MVSWLPPSSFPRSASADGRSLGEGWSGGKIALAPWTGNVPTRSDGTKSGQRALARPTR